jgi:N-acetylneuraminate lyase
MPLTGLIAAPHTPFREDGELNPDVIDLQAEHMVRTGVDGVFVCGTTGEGMSLTSAERRTVVERWVKAAAGRFPVVVHVGHPCQAEARELAAHAAGVGAAAVAAFAPFHLKAKYQDETGVVTFLEGVAAGAGGLPFYFYDFPELTGVRVPTAGLMGLAAERVPGFAGVKYTNPDLVTLQQCLQVQPGKLDVLFGIDELLLAAVALGVRGAVGSTYNFAAPVYRRMIAAFEAGDLPTARACQRCGERLVRAMEPGGLSDSKLVMRLFGIECGPVRPVGRLPGVTPDQRRAMDQDVRGNGLIRLHTQIERLCRIEPDGLYPRLDA